MRSTLTERGQTVVPAAIRKQYHLSLADRLDWVVVGDEIRVVPVRADPIDAFRGRGKGGASNRLIDDRAEERRREAAARTE